jgi:hypothetical protein
MEAQQIIALAEAHADKAQMRSSAELCIADAKSCLERGLVQYAKERALKSLAYSVGIFSPVYKQAKGE